MRENKFSMEQPIIFHNALWKEGCDQKSRGYMRMLTQTWATADSTELKDACEAGVRAILHRKTESDWINHPQTIQAKAQWDAVAQALGADGDCPDAVLAAARSLSAQPDATGFDRARETSCRRSAVELLLSMGYVWATDHWEARKQPDAVCGGDAAELFGMAQLAPEEGIEDAARRIEAYLADRQPAAATGRIPSAMVDGELSVASAIDRVVELFPSAHRAALRTLAACLTHHSIHRYTAPPLKEEPVEYQYRFWIEERDTWSGWAPMRKSDYDRITKMPEEGRQVRALYTAEEGSYVQAACAAHQLAGVEPVGWLHTYKKTGASSLATYPIDMDLAFNRERWECVALYTAPPTPAAVPVDVVRDAERYRRLKQKPQSWMLEYMKVSRPLGKNLDEALDATHTQPAATLEEEDSVADRRRRVIESQRIRNSGRNGATKESES
ncbi:hypothetical protein [Xanthomonas phage Carpasina]|uniref:Uncharacterized protein n=1 Tax=Xanthomonas phage Carpasina TaxID=2163636 RepID=A0A2S1GSS6_9CAUD|nr:hypothetical protein HOT16_gp53 [Xanthomonas phage Carpasina]AWD92448.1 hypothetical protein [Xanthomonas phage Carpasina]